MKKIKSSYLLFFLLFFITIMISTISASLAWLSIEGSKDVTLIPGSFIVSTNVKEKDATANLTPTNGVFTLNGLSSENDERAFDILIKDKYQDYSNMSELERKELIEKHYPQYFNLLIEEMQISINIETDIAGYMRVKLQDEWIVTRKYINFDRTTTSIIFKDQSTNQLYKLEKNWVYDEKTGFFYYSELIEKDFNGTIPFVKAGKAYGSNLSSYYVETCDVNISINVQVVQANRFEALWGISQIPQPVETGGDI